MISDFVNARLENYAISNVTTIRHQTELQAALIFQQFAVSCQNYRLQAVATTTTEFPLCVCRTYLSRRLNKRFFVRKYPPTALIKCCCRKNELKSKFRFLFSPIKSMLKQETAYQSSCKLLNFDFMLMLSNDR